MSLPLYDDLHLLPGYLIITMILYIFLHQFIYIDQFPNRSHWNERIRPPG